MKYITTIGEQDFLVEIIDEHHVAVNGEAYEVDFDSIFDQPVYSLLVDGDSYEAYVYSSESDWQILMMGRLFNATVEDEREKRLLLQGSVNVAERADFILKSPMPGLIVSLMVEEGQVIEKGDVLIVLESMKMQNELKSPRAGTVSQLRVKVGDSVGLRHSLLSVV